MIPVLLLAACTGTSTQDTSEDGTTFLEPPATEDGFQLKMTATAPPYEEVWKCAVYPLPTDEYSPINWVEYQQNEGTHHMTLSTPGLFAPAGTIPYGDYDCADLYGDASLMEDQIMFFGGQGTAEDTMYLPDGVVANMPPGIDIIHEIHYVNPTAETIDLYSIINAYTIDESEVEEGIWGGQVRDEFIEIPANSEHTEWTRCVMNTDVDVHFLASHTHENGILFTIAQFDGAETSEIFYENDDWHDPKIVQYNPPLTVPAGSGFEWACTWRNDTDEPILYGSTSADEMCNLAIVHTPFDMSAQCEVVESSDGHLWSAGE